MTEFGKRVIDFRILQSNGAPIPGWLGRAGSGLLIGQRPADVDSIGLRIVVVFSDGTSETKEVEIETMSGEIKPLAPGKRADVRLPFMEQLAADYSFADHERGDLARVLEPQ